MQIAIKNPAVAPVGSETPKWGDYHFGMALQRALEAQGAKVTQHLWPHWDRFDGEDITITLRGKRKFEPRRDQLSILWVISHPATVSLEEIDKYSLVYLGAETHYRMLRGIPRGTLRVLRQCADETLFFPPARAEDNKLREDVVFVANSRGYKRSIVEWALEANVRPKIYGRHWRKFGVGDLVAADYIDNDKLPEFYRRSRLSLNDHWTDMSYFGYVNNRIFDCVFCGLPVLSDEFPELRRVCGDGLLYARDAATFAASYDRYLHRYPEVLEKTAELRRRFRSEYTFAASAARILDDIERMSRVPWLARARLSARSAAISARRFARLQLGRRSTIDPDLLRVLFPRKPKMERYVLHISPLSQDTEFTAGLEGTAYLTAGPGAGPWEVALDEQLSQLEKKRFDAIIMDRGKKASVLRRRGDRELFSLLVRQLKRRGFLVVSTHRQPRSDFKWAVKLGLSVTKRGKGYVVLRLRKLRRAADKQAVKPDPAISPESAPQ